MNENEVSAAASDESAVNAAAAEELAAAATEQAAKANVEKTVADQSSVQKSPDKNAAGGQSAFDPQKSYEDLSRKYAETQKWATQQSQMRAQFEKEVASLKQQQAEVAKKLAEATEAPFNLEEFNKEFVKNGPKAFDSYFEKKLSEVKGQYEPRISELSEKNQRLEADLTILHRRTDAKNYPNFSDLEPKMVEILNSANCPVDKNLPLAEKLDAVYQLAKTSNSTEAIKAAKQVGYDKAQADLAKEARTAVATGGKGVSTTPADMQSMPLDKLEKLVIQMHGIADRD